MRIAHIYHKWVWQLTFEEIIFAKRNCISLTKSINHAYPLSFKGNGPTQSWAYDSAPSQLRYHAERTPYDWGFAWIHKTQFDHNKFLIVESALTLDTCFGDGACTNGPALINTEADYRAVYLEGTANSSTLELRRYAPRDQRPFYYANGTKVELSKGDIAKIKIAYAGASDKSWRYWLNDVEVFIKNGTQLQSTEKSEFLNAVLRDNPRIGIYPNVSGQTMGNYIEGRIFWVKAAQLEKINGISATASNSVTNFETVYAIDNNPNTTWSAGGYAPHWIELNLASIKSVKKIRLLTSQYPTGTTTHNIYIGANPSPAKLIATITGNTQDNSWIDIDLSTTGELGQYIRIKTTASPSWVSWKEIEVYD